MDRQSHERSCCIAQPGLPKSSGCQAWLADAYHHAARVDCCDHVQAVAFYEYQDVPGSDEELPDLDGAVSEDGSQAGSASVLTSAGHSPLPASSSKRRRCTASSALSDAGTGPGMISDDAASQLEPQAVTNPPGLGNDGGMVGTVSQGSPMQHMPAAPTLLPQVPMDHSNPSNGSAEALPCMDQPPHQQQGPDSFGLDREGADALDATSNGSHPHPALPSNHAHSDGAPLQQPASEPFMDAQHQLPGSMLNLPPEAAVVGRAAKAGHDSLDENGSGIQQLTLRHWPPLHAMETYPNVGHEDPPLAPRHANGAAIGTAKQAVQASMGSLDAESQPDLSPMDRDTVDPISNNSAAPQAYQGPGSKAALQHSRPCIPSTQPLPASSTAGRQSVLQPALAVGTVPDAASPLPCEPGQHKMQNGAAHTLDPAPNGMSNGS